MTSLALIQALHMPTFENWARRDPMGGHLSPSKSEGLHHYLDAWAQYGTSNEDQLAYMLATVHHEVGGTYQPAREGFKETDAEARRYVRNRKYGKPVGRYGHVYYGRGGVQLTWEENYIRMGKRIGVDLAKYPDLLVTDPALAAKVTVIGMVEGLFTGKKLSHYFGDGKCDPVGARYIVNGKDKNQLIAKYFYAFKDAITASAAAKLDLREKEEPPVAKIDWVKDAPAIGTLITAVTGIAGTVGKTVADVDNAYSLGAVAAILGGAFIFFKGRKNIFRKTGR